MIKQELQTLSKYPELDTDLLLSSILRRQILSSMLHVIEEYPFCSIACSQAIQILDFFKTVFDDEELSLLKAFIQRSLLQHPHLVFDSGQRTSNSNLFAIVRMGIVLKTMTLGTSQHLDQDDEESKQEEGHKPRENNVSHSREVNDPEWREFCLGAFAPHEVKWNKKIEDYIREREEA